MIARRPIFRSSGAHRAVTTCVTKADRQRNRNEWLESKQRHTTTTPTREEPLPRGYRAKETEKEREGVCMEIYPPARVCGPRNGNRSSSILAVASRHRYTLQWSAVGGPSPTGVIAIRRSRRFTFRQIGGAIFVFSRLLCVALTACPALVSHVWRLGKARSGLSEPKTRSAPCHVSGKKLSKHMCNVQMAMD